MERLFVALPLSEPAKDKIESYVQNLQQQGLQGRFVTRQNYHITLAFIGESDERRNIENALKNLSFAPVEIRIDGFVRFGSLLALRVENTPALNELSRQVRLLLDQAGIGFDHKAFKAHITLARKVKDLPELTPFLYNESAEEVILYSSVFEEGKRIYTPLQVLKAAGKEF